MTLQRVGPRGSLDLIKERQSWMNFFSMALWFQVKDIFARIIWVARGSNLLQKKGGNVFSKGRRNEAGWDQGLEGSWFSLSIHSQTSFSTRQGVRLLLTLGSYPLQPWEERKEVLSILFQLKSPRERLWKAWVLPHAICPPRTIVMARDVRHLWKEVHKICPLLLTFYWMCSFCQAHALPYLLLR